MSSAVVPSANGAAGGNGVDEPAAAAVVHAPDGRKQPTEVKAVREQTGSISNEGGRSNQGGKHPYKDLINFGAFLVTAAGVAGGAYVWYQGKRREDELPERPKARPVKKAVEYLETHEEEGPPDEAGINEDLASIGVIVPAALDRFVASVKEGSKHRPLGLEGPSGIGKTSAVLRSLKGEKGVLYLPCKEVSSVMAAFATTVGIEDSRLSIDELQLVFKSALFEYKEKHGKPVTVIVDDLHRVFDKDDTNKKSHTEELLSACMQWYYKGALNLLVFGNEAIKRRIEEADVTGRSRFTYAEIVPASREQVLGPLTKQVEEKFGLSAEDAEKLAGNLLTVLGTHYMSLNGAVRGPSPNSRKEEEAAAVAVDAVMEQSSAMKECAGAGTLLRRIVESETGALVGDEAYDGDGKRFPDEKALEKANLIRVDSVSVNDEGKTRIQAHHGAVFAAAAIVVRNDKAKLSAQAKKVVLAHDALKQAALKKEARK